MEIKVLGTGCAKCKKLEQNVKEALLQLGKTGNVEKVEDINDIMDFGVLQTPALVVDGQVKFVGKSPTVEELKTKYL